MDAQGRACDASLGSTPLLRNVTKGQVINSAAFLLFSVGLLHSKREPRTTPSVSALKIVKDPGCAHADHVLAWRGSNKFLIQVGDPKNAARGHTPWNGRRETGGQTSNWSAKICFDSHGFFGGGKNHGPRKFTSGPPTGSYLGKFTATSYRNRFFQRSYLFSIDD